jgi:hypothetical protein
VIARRSESSPGPHAGSVSHLPAPLAERMRTQPHQQAFPGEDISDRPPPEEAVPGLLALIESSLPSGRYRARELAGLPA